MARRVVGLTYKEVETAPIKDKSYKLYDGEGLHLLVRSSGTKVWQYSYSFKGKKSTYTIGEFHKNRVDSVGPKEAIGDCVNQPVSELIWLPLTISLNGKNEISTAKKKFRLY